MLRLVIGDRRRLGSGTAVYLTHTGYLVRLSASIPRTGRQ